MSVSDLWYRLKCWAWHRYSTVRPRTLPHTWCDRSHLLPHVMFEVLGRFLEEECGEDGIVDWDSDEQHRTAMAEMRELWRWWNEEYLKFDGMDLLDGVEAPSLLEDGPRRRLGDGTEVFSMKFHWSSDEARAAYDEASAASYEAEAAMEAELKSRMKRLVDVKDFMWT